MKAIVFFLLFFISEVCAAPGKLPLPRFASLRSHKVNIHVGPGSDFPTEWTFQRQGLPIEIIAEFDTWRQIRDMEGTTGWVHKSLLIGKRTAVVIPAEKQQKSAEAIKADRAAKAVEKAETIKADRTSKAEVKAAAKADRAAKAVEKEEGKETSIAEKHSIRRSAAIDAPVVAYVEPGVVAKLKQCKGEWCRVDIKGYDGWIHRTHIWGTYPHEEKF